MDVAHEIRLLIKSKPARLTRLQKEAWVGLFFLLPWIIGFLLLKALPILAAFVFSLTNFKMLSPESTQFIGLENYLRLLHDGQAGGNLLGSLEYFLLTVPLELVMALILAAVLSSNRVKNKRLSQTL